MTTTPLTVEIDGPSTGVEAIIAAARAGQAVEELDLGSVYARQRSDGGVDVIDLTGDAHLAQLDAIDRRVGIAPSRKKGRVDLTEVASLATYVNSHKGMASTLWADRDQGRITAVLNDHGTEPDWRDHRAVLTLRQTPAWKAWTAVSGRQLPQAEFADFLEDHLPDIVDPEGAVLLEVATSIQGSVGAAMKSAIRTDSGEVKIRYEETVEATAGRAGDLTIPTRITLALTPWEGVDPYKVTARLRWRVANGSLTLGVILDQPEDVLRAAFANLVEVLEAETDLHVLHGSPA